MTMKLIQSILNQENCYSSPACFELAGEKVTVDGVVWNLTDMPCIKCEEDIFLIRTDDGALIYDKAAGTGFQVGKDSGPSCDDLNGWTAELAYAPLTVATCDFEDGNLCFDGEKLPISLKNLKGKLYLLSAETEAGKVALVLDISRFLFYGVVCGKLMEGFFKNIKVDR